MITYFGGPEGAGKTALMTRYLRMHHLAGGEVWAFPGYELKNDRGRVVSRLIDPTEIMGLLDDMQYIVLVADEIQNFFNHHAWQNPLIDVLSYGALAQRRKREFGFMATGPFFETLPPDLRMYFHIKFSCIDKHWRDHAIPRGEQIRFTETDLRGVLSGRPGYTLPPRVFRPKRYFKYYDTFSLVDPKYQHLRVRIKKDTVLVDSQGNEIQYTKPNVISDLVNDFIRARKNPSLLSKYELNNYIATRLGKDILDHNEIITLGRLMGGRGYQNKAKRAVWQLPDLAGG